MIGTLETQIQIEESIREEAIQKYIDTLNTAITQGRFDGTNEGTFLVKSTMPTYAAALQEFFKQEDTGKLQQDKVLLGMMVNSIDVLSLLVISIVVRGCAISKQNTPIVSIASGIVNELSKVSLTANITRNNPKFMSYLGTEFKRANKRRKEMLITKHIKDLKDFDAYTKDKKVSVRIGVMLLDILINSGANLVEKYSAFASKGATQKTSCLRLTADATEAILSLGKNALSSIMLTSPRLPTVIPPVDYDTTTLKGGYYKYPISLVKAAHAKQRRFVKNSDYSKIIPVVNKIQSVPWRFNKRIVDVITDIFEGNMYDPSAPGRLPKLFGGLPTSNVLNIDELLPKAEFGELKEGWQLGSEGFHAYTKAKNEMLILLDKENGNRFSVIFALAVFTKMCDYDKFYFPHQLDYRGRIYPNPQFVSVQQPAYIKAMLEFGDGIMLTPTGLEGLKIHMANCWGYDKDLFEGRIKFIDDKIESILAIAADPMQHILEWNQADSPFEYLAGCLAYADHLAGKPVHLPTQWDSTCSGIQVYSGLLLDAEGAESVNVIGQSRNDIYKKVADRVNLYLEAGDYPTSFEYTDSEGVKNNISTIVEAMSLRGKITRSIVKRNVMTVPYSVSFRGMNDQLRGTLEDLKFSGQQFWNGEFWVVVRLLATLNQRAIGEIVKGAQLGQEYFKAIAKPLKDVAIWKTPIYNIPILQPAFKIDVYRVRTLMGQLSVQYSTDELDTRGQVNGIAPNIIHSLDSTILYGAVDRYVGAIGTIHDCFMVHPNDYLLIKDHFKESYIELMEANPMEYIGNQLDPEGLVPVPSIGTLDLNDVRNSQYIIS